MTTEWPVRIDCIGGSCDQCQWCYSMYGTLNSNNSFQWMLKKCFTKRLVNHFLILLITLFMSFSGAAISVSEFIEGGKKWIKAIFNNEEAYKSMAIYLRPVMITLTLFSEKLLQWLHIPRTEWLCIYTSPLFALQCAYTNTNIVFMRCFTLLVIFLHCLWGLETALWSQKLRSPNQSPAQDREETFMFSTFHMTLLRTFPSH